MNKKSLLIFENKKLVLVLIVCVIIFLLIGFYFIHLYQGIMENKTEDYEEVKSLAMEAEEVEEIHNIDRFHGDHLYYVLNATSSDGKEIILYMYQIEDEWQYKTFNSDPLYSESDILSEWQNRCSNCEMLGSSIGIDNNIPVLEIKYLNEANKLVYEHVLLEDKSYYQLTLDPSF